MKSLPLLILLAGAALWLIAANALLPLSLWPDALLPVGERSLPEIRLVFGLMPRAAVALLVGASLGLAGALLQRVLRNPLADPTVLGVSAVVCCAICVSGSLIQDLKVGHLLGGTPRKMEIAEIVLAPLEFARAANVPIPALETLGAVVARLARDRGLLA